jgi:hypothetical protein
MEGLGDVSGRHTTGAFQVGQGPRNAQDAVVGAPGQAKALHGRLQQSGSRRIHLSHLA